MLTIMNTFFTQYDIVISNSMNPVNINYTETKQHTDRDIAKG